MTVSSLCWYQQLASGRNLDTGVTVAVQSGHKLTSLTSRHLSSWSEPCSRVKRENWIPLLTVTAPHHRPLLLCCFFHLGSLCSFFPLSSPLFFHWHLFLSWVHPALAAWPGCWLSLRVASSVLHMDMREIFCKIQCLTAMNKCIDSGFAGAMCVCECVQVCLIKRIHQIQIGPHNFFFYVLSQQHSL